MWQSSPSVRPSARPSIPSSLPTRCSCVVQKPRTRSRWHLAKDKCAFICFSPSSRNLRGLQPWRPPLLCKKSRSGVYHGTFVPVWSSVSIRALIVIRELLLTSRQTFLASLGDTLRFLPRPLLYLLYLLITLWTFSTRVITLLWNGIAAHFFIVGTHKSCARVYVCQLTQNLSNRFQ